MASKFASKKIIFILPIFFLGCPVAAFAYEEMQSAYLEDNEALEDGLEEADYSYSTKSTAAYALSRQEEDDDDQLQGSLEEADYSEATYSGAAYEVAHKKTHKASQSGGERTKKEGKPRKNKRSGKTNEHDRARLDRTGLVSSIPKLTKANTPLQFVKAHALKEKQKKSGEKKKPKGYFPFVELGGTLSGSISSSRGYTRKLTSDISLGGANLVVAADVSPWVGGLVSFNYDPASPPTYAQSANRVTNSRVFLGRAFMTLANIEETPFYASLGQMTMPFGEYSSQLGGLPLTARIGKMMQRAIILGFQEQNAAPGFNIAGYLFKGPSRAGSASKINNGGVDVNYGVKEGNLQVLIGGGFVHNVADASAMQNTAAPFVQFDDALELVEGDDGELDEEFAVGGTTFSGFGNTAGGNVEALMHRVGAADAHVKFIFKSLSLYGEYTGALRRFDAIDLSFNDLGAKPSAFHLEAAYGFKAWELSHTFAVGCSHTYQAYALNAPKSNFGLAFRTRWNSFVSTSLTFGRDKGYSLSDTGTGGGDNPVASAASRGKHSTTISLGAALSF